MKVLYLSPVGTMGGAEQCLLNVIASVRSARPDAELHLLCAGEGPLLSRVSALGVSANVAPMARQVASLGESILGRHEGLLEFAKLGARALLAMPGVARYLRDLRREIRRIDPDIIHSNGLKTHLLASLLPLRRSHTLWHLHDFLAQRPAMARALRWASPRCDGVIAISEAVANDARLVLPETRVSLIYNGIDLHHFSYGSEDDVAGDEPGVALRSLDGVADLDSLAHLPPAPEGTLRVGLVATFARWKGQDILLEAAARYFQQFPDAPLRFYIVGGPIYHTRGSQFSEQELHRHARHLGLGSRIGFIGFQADTRPIYRALDIVVHASVKPEPFGLTIVEAMACARPVIVSRAGGAVELFTPGVDGVGVPPADVGALVAAIADLASNPQRRRTLGKNASATALRRFCRDRLGRQVLEVYESVLTDWHLPNQHTLQTQHLEAVGAS